MNFSDFSTFTPEQCLNQFIYHIYLEQVECSFFFLKSVPDELYIPKINLFCDVLNADDTSFLFLKGTLSYFISRLSNELENKQNDESFKSKNCSNLPIMKKPIIPDSFYLSFLDMDKIKSKDTTILLQIFTGKSDFFQKNKSSNSKQQNPDDKKPVIQAIASLFEKHRGLYTALLRHGYMEALLLRIGPEPLFNYFKLNSFSLREQFDKSYLSYFSPKMVNSSNFGQFWSQCPIIFDSKSSQLFQSLFACDNPYPYFSTKYFPESDLNNEILSLTNDVLTKRNKSFIDIILIVCRTLIINGLKATKDQECFLMYTKQFPDLRILSFLAEYESIKNDSIFDNVVLQLINNMKSDASSISQIDPNSIMTEVIERFGNDYSLCFYLTNTIGRKTRTADLEKMSIPKYLMVHANLDVDCSAFNDKKMFVINDKDRKNDLVFIFSYQALCLIVNQIHNLKKNVSQIDFSEISITDSLSEASLSLSDINLTFSDKLTVLIEYIKSLTNDESFEKIMIDLFSVIFITEKVQPLNDSNNKMVNFVFTDDQITEIVSILFHFCPKQKEIKKAFLKFKFIRTLSQKKFEEAKNLSENENDSLYRLAMIAELISKISNSEQWTFPSCIDKSFFDAEYLLSNNEDFGADMSNICPELTTLVAMRRNFKKKRKYSPYELYDIENTKKNINAFNSLEYEKIEKDQRCIQFNDFIDFERKLDTSGNKNLNNLDDIISFEIKNDKVSSLLTLKTVPEEYKDNKFINAIFERTNNANSNNSNRNETIDLNEEIQTVEDISNYLKKCDENLLFIDETDFQILLTKSFTFNPLPYEILNDLYLRNEKVTTSFYNSLINKLKIYDFCQIMPFCFYRSLSKYSKKSNVNMDQNLIEFLEYLVVNKKFMNAKQFAEDFHLTIQLELIIKQNISEDDYQTIESTFPQLKEYIEKVKNENESRQYIPSETEIYIMNQLQDFINYEENEFEEFPTFFNLFPIFDSIKKNLESVSSSLMTQIVEIVTTLLSNSSVDSLEAEMNATEIFPRLLNFMKLFKLRMLNLSESSNYQALLYQLECLTKLVCCGFYSKFREVFNFNNFFSKQQGASYASLCQKYDRIGILRDIQTYWSLTEYRFFDSVLNCFKLGLLKSGNIELKEAVKAHQALKIDCHSLANELIPILSFVKPFAASSYKEKIAGLSELKKSKIDFTKLIEKDECIITKSLHFSSKKSDKQEEEFPIIHITSPQIISLNDSLSIIGACEDQILFHCQFGDFEEAFKLFNQFYLNGNNIGNIGVAMSGNAFRLSVFMRVLITPAIAFKQWNFFWRKLVRCLKPYLKVIDEFINFLGQNKMYFILFDIQKRLEYNDNALLAAIKLFERTDSWKKQQELLNTMNGLIQKSLKLNSQEDKKKHKSFFSVDSLFQLQRRTNVQLAIVSMFINTKVPFDKNLELMTSKENTINLASFLLLKFQIGYFSEICELPDITMDEICENAIEILNSGSKREEGSISGFFKNLTKLETGTYRKLIMCLSKSIYRRVPDENSFVEFVTRNIKGDDLIAAVLQSFGFENEADIILKKKSHK